MEDTAYVFAGIYRGRAVREQLVDLEHIRFAVHAFAAVKADDSVVKRISRNISGDSRAVQEPVVTVTTINLGGCSTDCEGAARIATASTANATVDALPLSIHSGVFEVVATYNDALLAGEGFDQKVMAHFIRFFNKKHVKAMSKDSEASRSFGRTSGRRGVPQARPTKAPSRSGPFSLVSISRRRAPALTSRRPTTTSSRAHWNPWSRLWMTLLSKEHRWARSRLGWVCSYPESAAARRPGS